MTSATLREELRDRGLQPHQADFVELVLAGTPGARFLLADPPGSGKTPAVAVAVAELARQTTSNFRALVLAPNAALTNQWRHQLKQWGGLDATLVDAAEYRRLEARTASNRSPWEATDLAVSSFNLASDVTRLKALLAVPWDVVVIDEVHRCTSEGPRGRVLRSLWFSENVSRGIACSAAPHTGYSADFKVYQERQTKIIRRHFSDLRGWNGEPLPSIQTERVIEVVPIEFTNEEIQLIESLRSATQGVANPLHRFSIARRAASSLLTLEQMLRRISLSPSPSFALTVEGDPQTDPELVQTGLGSHAATLLLEVLDEIRFDSKLEKFRQLLNSLEPTGNPVLVFCDYLDTARYLSTAVEEMGLSCCTITSNGDRLESLEWFRNRGAVAIVTGAADGLDLAFVKRCIHYDVPLSIGGLQRRFGRVHRFGATAEPVKHWFIENGIFPVAPVIDKLINFESRQSEDDVLVPVHETSFSGLDLGDESALELDD